MTGTSWGPGTSWGLSLCQASRYRDLEAGVFLTRDPLGFVDGPNVYTYVRLLRRVWLLRRVCPEWHVLKRIF